MIYHRRAATLTTKTCPVCKRELAVSEFGLTRGAPRSRCKQCARDDEKRRRIKDPDAVRAKARASWEKNGDRNRARKRSSYAANVDVHRDRSKNWREANKELYRSIGRAYAAAHRDAAKEKARAWYQANPDRAKSNVKAYRDNNSDKVRALCAVRRARVRGVDAERVSPKELFDRDGWVCGLCFLKVKKSLRYPHPMSASMDHIVPISTGGVHRMSNLQCAHLICNVKKSAGPGGQLRLFG